MPWREWKELCLARWKPGYPFGIYSGYNYQEIELRAMGRMSEMELCLLELYGYQSIRDLSTVTGKMDQIFECNFGERFIDGVLHNIRKLVSLRYEEAEWIMRWKKRTEHPIRPDEPTWMHWASLSANEERKIRNTHPSGNHPHYILVGGKSCTRL